LRDFSNEVAAIGAPMSAVPQVSQFWHMDGTNSSKILTWHNFFQGRVFNSASPTDSITPTLTQSHTFSLTNSITHPLSQFLLSAQLELFPNGDYIARSNLVERYYKRINPDDFDDDGIPNDIDENPHVNDGDNFGPSPDLPDGANAGNYCWVDIVVNNANSLVTFVGDKPSNLPDPRFIAKAGTTHRVNLLIGKTYRVVSAQPIECTAMSDEAICVEQTSESSMRIVYPVSYEVVGAMRSVSRQIRMVPPITGTIQWDTNSCPCHAQTSGAGYDLPMCNGACSCYSCAPGGFTFHYEGYSLSFGGVECDCNPYANDVEDDGPYAASASVSFSKSAVIFEDEYMNTSTESVPRRSTSTTLTCTAHGGPNGGRAIFTLGNAGKLICKSGVTLPIEVDVPAGHKVSFEIVYEGAHPSESENDVVATAQFVDNEGGELETAVDEMTVVEVELRAIESAKENSCGNRHIYGVHEWVESLHIPTDMEIAFSIEGCPEDLFNDDFSKFFCPWNGGEYYLSAQVFDVIYRIKITVMEPILVCREVGWEDIGVLGESGLIDMRLALYVEPRTVSFHDLYMVELPDTDECPRSGYFSSGDIEKIGALSHTTDAGAGEWGPVKIDYSWRMDRVCRATAYPRPWSNGWKEWRIPVGWGDYLRSVKGTMSPNPTTQKFTIDSNGTATIRKYNHEIKRTVDDHVWIDGILKK
jgi:hypothetical protein